jgi:uncharacterized membrane protein
MDEKSLGDHPPNGRPKQAEDGSASPETVGPSQNLRSLNSDPVLGRPKSVRGVSHMREWARQWVAIIIVSCLALTVLMSFSVLFYMVYLNKATIGDAKDVISLVVGPVIGIVGAVTGFYFSKMQNDDDEDSDE